MDYLNTCHCPSAILGDGHHPHHDPFGRLFDDQYHPDLASLAGTEIIPSYKAVLEGIQCDQEYCKLIFGLNHYYNRKQCCHLCNVIQWTSRCPAPGESNDPNDLYTNFAADETRTNPSCSLVWFLFLQHVFAGTVWRKHGCRVWTTGEYIRIVDLATFIQIHGQSAMSRVIGFSPDRFLASLSFNICSSDKNTKLFIWLFLIVHIRMFLITGYLYILVWAQHHLPTWDNFHLVVTFFGRKQQHSKSPSIQLRHIAGHYAHLPLESIPWRFLFNPSGLNWRSEVSPWKFSGR